MVNDTENWRLWAEFNEKLLVEEYYWVKITYVLVISVVFFVSMVGNLLTCIVIYIDRSMHTATNYYLFNLAISDMVVSLAIIIEVNEHFMSKNFFIYMYGELTCKIHYILVVTLWNHGVLVMTALAVERYIAICHPLLLKSKPVWRRVGKIIGIIWVVAIILSVPDFWTISLTKTAKGNICYLVPTREARIVNGVLALVIFVIPLMTMVFVYTMIACRVSSMQRASGRDKVFNHRDNRSKVNKLVVALTLSFLVCWLPFFTVRLIIFALDVKQIVALNHWWTVLYTLAGLNSWFSSVLNPLLFSLMSTKFRKALKLLWNRLLKKLSRSKNDNNLKNDDRRMVKSKIDRVIII